MARDLVTSAVRTSAVRTDRLELRLRFPENDPVEIEAVHPTGGRSPSLVAPHPLVTLFTLGEKQSSRMSWSYADSALGQRMRYISHRESADEREVTVEILQRDADSGLAVTTLLTLPRSAAAIRFSQLVTNEGDDDVILLAVSSASLGFAGRGIGDLDLVWGESGWTSEGRWHETPLDKLLPPVDLGRYGQDAARRFGLTSAGTWSTSEFLPTGVVADRASGAAMVWQIESSGPWHWEVGQTPAGGYLAVLGPTDAEHGFAARLAPGGEFTTPPTAVAFSGAGRDGAFAALTDYRRSIRQLRPADAVLPIVYNDFMNTLHGDPSTEKLEPLIRAAAEAGVEYFCIDAGWFAEAGRDDWWNQVGEWREGSGRFAGGLGAVADLIRSVGMVPGLWLEPEVVGVESPVAATLPDAAFFQRFGRRVVTQERYHLDFRHEAACAHLDETVDRLVETYGIGFFKLDYNIDPGAGTDVTATSPAEGLLGHVRAHRRWLAEVQERHPGVLFENCGAGAMRMDYGLLSLAHLQSTSDQPDHLLYPPIAVSAPASILPEQAGNWAYPSADMDAEQTAFALLAGLAGRLYLAGFLDRLDDAQHDLVREAVELSKIWRHRIAASHPVWPLGLPAWDAPRLAIALDCGDEYLLAVWSRGEAAELTMNLPVAVGEPIQIFPAALPAWPSRVDGARLTLGLPAGPAARLFRLDKLSD